MLYMVIETFDASAEVVYTRFAEKGRMLPDGVHYIDSWVTIDRRQCFQIMSAEAPELLDVWMGYWNDIVSFEVLPILSSRDAQKQTSGMEQVSTRGGS